MCKIWDKIKEFREGNRIVLKCECNRTVTARRKEDTAPCCHMDMKSSGEMLLVDLLAAMAAIHVIGSFCRGVCCLCRKIVK